MVFPPMLFVQVRADRGWNTRVDSGPQLEAQLAGLRCVAAREGWR